MLFITYLSMRSLINQYVNKVTEILNIKNSEIYLLQFSSVRNSNIQSIKSFCIWDYYLIVNKINIGALKICFLSVFN